MVPESKWFLDLPNPPAKFTSLTCSGQRVPIQWRVNYGCLRHYLSSTPNVGKSVIPCRCASTWRELWARSTNLGAVRAYNQSDKHHCCLVSGWSCGWFRKISGFLSVLFDYKSSLLFSYSPSYSMGSFREFWDVLLTGWGHTNSSEESLKIGAFPFCPL